ncbi:putative transport and Golgi organization protein 6 like protein [Blattamonas nauphoetae]|uniref:Transport and Golgi organization protein 6 like protein n=1 Tax=Blattamonas nauphoetae TaxID=2049346 RepID=A0ABQ9Y458_9EUKA|nr:putative transport and Golgi organization protein 6 like protein [Blattamonas nauphoetae]
MQQSFSSLISIIRTESTPVLISTLCSLLSPHPQTPDWFKGFIRVLLNSSILRPLGVQTIFQTLLPLSDSSTSKQMKRGLSLSLTLFTTIPPYIPLSTFFSRISPQIRSLLTMRISTIKPDYQPEMIAMIQASTALVSALAAKFLAETKTYIMEPICRPFFAFSVSDAASDRPSSFSEADVSSALDVLHLFLHQSPHPISAELLNIFSGFIPALFGMYCLVFQSVSNTKTACREALVGFFKILSTHSASSESNDLINPPALVFQELIIPHVIPASVQSVSAPINRTPLRFAHGDSGGVCMSTESEGVGIETETECAVVLLKDLTKTTHISADVIILAIQALTAERKLRITEGEMVLGAMAASSEADEELPDVPQLSQLTDEQYMWLLNFVMRFCEQIGPSGLKTVTHCARFCSEVLSMSLSSPQEASHPTLITASTDDALVEVVMSILVAVGNGALAMTEADVPSIRVIVDLVQKFLTHHNETIKQMAVFVHTSFSAILIRHKQNPTSEVTNHPLDTALSELRHTLIPVRAHGLRVLSSLLAQHDERAMTIHADIHEIIAPQLNETDHFVVGFAIDCYATLVDVFPDIYLPHLIESINAQLDSNPTRALALCDTVLRGMQKKGEMMQHYSDDILSPLFTLATRQSPLQGSFLADLAELVWLMKEKTLQYIHQLVRLGKNVLTLPSSTELSRRGAAHLLSQILRLLNSVSYTAMIDHADVVLEILNVLEVHSDQTKEDDPVTRKHCRIGFGFGEDIVKRIGHLPKVGDRQVENHSLFLDLIFTSQSLGRFGS